MYQETNITGVIKDTMDGVCNMDRKEQNTETDIRQ